MSEGQGSTPERPPGWAAEQPPPYQGSGASPWAPPEPSPEPARDAPPGYGQAPPPPPPHGYGQAPPYGYAPPPPEGSYGYRPPQQLRPGIIPLRPLGLGDILDGTIKLIRSHPRATLGLSAIVAALGAIPVSVGQALMVGSLGEALEDPGAVSGMALIGQYGGALLSLIIQFIAVTLLGGVLTKILGRAVFGGRITAVEAWRLVRPRVGALFLLVLLTGLILVGPLFVLIPLFLLAAAQAGDPTPLFIATLVLLLLYIPYALFFSTRLALSAPAVVLERLSAVDGMRRSWRLVSGSFWRVFGIILLITLLAGMIGSVLSVPFTLVGTFIPIFAKGSTGSVILSAVLLTLGTTIASTISYPIQAGVNGLLYADRRMRAEAFDLVLQTAAIEQHNQGWVPATVDDLWLPGYAAPPSQDQAS